MITDQPKDFRKFGQSVIDLSTVKAGISKRHGIDGVSILFNDGSSEGLRGDDAQAFLDYFTTEAHSSSKKPCEIHAQEKSTIY